MNKHILAVLFITACFLLSGCKKQTTQTGGTTVTEDTKAAEKPPKAEKKQEDLVITETVEETDVPALISQAIQYQVINEHKKAVAYLRKAKQLKPDTTEVRELLIKSYRELGASKYELNELKELIGIKPDNTYRVRCAQILREKKAYSEAINAIEDVRAVDPENISAILELGRIYKDQKMFEEAIETFKEITYIDEKNALSKYYLAEIYLDQNKLLWADKYYKDALKRDPALGLAEYGLAKIAKIRNDNANYESHLSRAYELNPENEEIRKAYLKR